MRVQARQRWSSALAVSVLIHAALLAAMLASIRILRPPAEPRSIELRLLAPTFEPAHRRPPSPGGTGGAHAPAAAAAPARPALPVSPGPEAPGGPAGEDLGAAHGFLRGALGCAEQAMARLTEAERVRCAERLARGVDPNRPFPAPIAPEKRAWFDAIVRARQQPGRPPMLGCGISFSGIKPVKPRKPAHSLQLGPLPCFILPPKGSLTEDVDIATPSRHDPLVDPYDRPPPVYSGPGPDGPPGPS